MVTAASSTSRRAGPVRLRATAHDVLSKLARGESVRTISPILRRWLRDQGYVTWTGSGSDRGERDFRITDLGRSVIETAIRLPPGQNT